MKLNLELVHGGFDQVRWIIPFWIPSPKPCMDVWTLNWCRLISLWLFSQVDSFPAPLIRRYLRNLQNESKMFPTIAYASKTLYKCLVLSAILRTFSFSLASDFEELSVTDAQMSKGTLIYGALPEAVKLTLFKNYQTTYKRKVITDSHRALLIDT